MKTYQVELKRVSYVTVTVEAENMGAAWLVLQTGAYDDVDADWSLSDVEEIRAAKNTSPPYSRRPWTKSNSARLSQPRTRHKPTLALRRLGAF